MYRLRKYTSGDRLSCNLNIIYCTPYRYNLCYTMCNCRHSVALGSPLMYIHGMDKVHITLQVFSLSEDLVSMGKMDPEPPQRTGIIVAFDDMNEFEK